MMFLPPPSSEASNPSNSPSKARTMNRRNALRLLSTALALPATLRASRAAADGGRGRVERGIVVMEDGAPRPNGSNLVAYLEPVPGEIPPEARVHRSIRQRNLQFEPRLLVVPVRSTIEFPNDDRIFHNVFSLSRTQRFDLGLYRSGDSKSVTFRR